MCVYMCFVLMLFTVLQPTRRIHCIKVWHLDAVCASYRVCIYVLYSTHAVCHPVMFILLYMYIILLYVIVCVYMFYIAHMLFATL
jgi:hypothetical protein